MTNERDSNRILREKIQTAKEAIEKLRPQFLEHLIDIRLDSKSRASLKG
jgi:hypothetical protein